MYIFKLIWYFNRPVRYFIYSNLKKNTKTKHCLFDIGVGYLYLRIHFLRIHFILVSSMIELLVVSCFDLPNYEIFKNGMVITHYQTPCKYRTRDTNYNIDREVNGWSLPLHRARELIMSSATDGVAFREQFFPWFKYVFSSVSLILSFYL